MKWACTVKLLTNISTGEFSHTQLNTQKRLINELVWSLTHTRHNLGHFGGQLHSKSHDWYWQTRQYRNISKICTVQNIQIEQIKMNWMNKWTQKANKAKYNQNKTTQVQSVASYDTRPGYKTDLLYNAPEPTRGIWSLTPYKCYMLVIKVLQPCSIYRPKYSYTEDEEVDSCHYD